jgi:hypothetical protein
MARLSRRGFATASTIFAGCYILAGTVSPWLVLITDPLSACKGYCVLITSQYTATVSSYWQYVQIAKSATLLDTVEVVLSLLPLAAAIPALYLTITMSDRSPEALLRWGYVFVLGGALTMAAFAVFLALLTLPLQPRDWTKLVLSLVQLTAIITLVTAVWERHNRLSRVRTSSS